MTARLADQLDHLGHDVFILPPHPKFPAACCSDATHFSHEYDGQQAVHLALAAEEFIARSTNFQTGSGHSKILLWNSLLSQDFKLYFLSRDANHLSTEPYSLAAREIVRNKFPITLGQHDRHDLNPLPHHAGGLPNITGSFSEFFRSIHSFPIYHKNLTSPDI